MNILRVLSVAAAASGVVTQSFGRTDDEGTQCPDAVEIQRYDVDLTIRPVDLPFFQLYGGDIDVTCAMTVKNTGDAPCREIPLILYRLLEVRDVSEQTGNSVPFRQAIQKHPSADYGARHQVNVVTLQLQKPLGPGEERKLTVQYGGPVCGRPESLAYVWDHVGWDYTLLRSEVNWYPTIAYMQTRFRPFTYRVDICVPSHLIAVAEGKLIGVEEVGDRTTYSYESERTHRFLFSVAAAPFEKREVGGGITFFFLSEDAEGAEAPIRALKRTEELCGRWFGTAPRAELKVVEVPQKYGSQSAPGMILQQSVAFRVEDGDQSAAYRRALRALGHEAIHRWHPLPDKRDRTRFLDEGIAHYFEALLVKEESGEEAFCEVLEEYRERFLAGGEEALKIPIAEAGASEAVDAISRGKGPWVLYTLHHWLGDEVFFGIIRAYCETYQHTTVTLEDFVAVAKRESRESLDRFFDEWFYGVESSRYLKEGLSVREIAARYR